MPDSDRSPGLRIGTLWGVPILLGRSWFVVAAAIVLLFGPQIQRIRPGLGAASYVVSLCYVLLLLVSVLVHEAAHALVGKSRGYDVHEIVADLWGGHTSYRTVDSSPASMALVAVVGPLSNLALAGLGHLVIPHLTDDVLGLLMAAFVWANVFVGVFNLLPGLPLDGGHLVDALVWRITGSRAAGVRAAGWSGRVMVVLVVLWFVVRPLVQGDSPDIFSIVWTLFICSFLWQGASAAVAAGGDMKLLSAVHVGELTHPVAFAPIDTPVRQVDARDTVVLDHGGAPIGVASTGAIRTAAAGPTGTTLASVTLTQPAGWVVQVGGADDDVTEIVRAVNANPAPLSAVLVLDAQHRPLGLVSVAELDSTLQATQARRAAARAE